MNSQEQLDMVLELYQLLEPQEEFILLRGSIYPLKKIPSQPDIKCLMANERKEPHLDTERGKAQLWSWIEFIVGRIGWLKFGKYMSSLSDNSYNEQILETRWFFDKTAIIKLAIEVLRGEKD